MNEVIFTFVDITLVYGAFTDFIQSSISRSWIHRVSQKYTTREGPAAAGY